jgi:hypothetical protein
MARHADLDDREECGREIAEQHGQGPTRGWKHHRHDAVVLCDRSVPCQGPFPKSLRGRPSARITL